MYPDLLTLGIVLSVLGAGVAAVLSLLARGSGMRRAGLIVLALGTALGAIASCAYLITNPQLETVPTFLGVPFHFDVLSAVFFGILNMVGCIVSLFSITYLEHYASTYNLRTVNALTAIFIFGMQGVLLAATPFIFLVFWEIMSMSSFFLVMADKKPESIRAALFYLIMTHLGAGAILAGFMVLAGGALTLNFGEIGSMVRELSTGTVSLAFGLLFFGFASKAGLWPFHLWLPEAHPQAPSHISALMSGVMLKMALYGFLRVLLTMIPVISKNWALLVIALGLASAIFGVLYAVIERDLKRLLAYSSIENIGLMFTMVGTALYAHVTGLDALASIALAAVVLHAIAHAVFKSGLFMGAGTIISQLHTRNLEQMGGLAKRMPKFSVAMLILALGAAALPPFAAFMGEWLFLQGAVAAMQTAPLFERSVLVVIVAGIAFVGGLAVFAMIKMFAIAFLAKPRSEHAEQATEPSRGLAWPVLAMAAFTILIGFFAPTILKTIGFTNVTDGARIMAGSGNLSPILLAIMLAVVFVIVTLARRWFSNARHERTYHTWDCGQPINATMEYTATAFAAPIRFFFRLILQPRKDRRITPVVATNPWIGTHEVYLSTKPVWFDLIYLPLARATLFVSTQVRRIHNGIIQFYIALILIALIATLTIAL